MDFSKFTKRDMFTFRSSPTPTTSPTTAVSPVNSNSQPNGRLSTSPESTTTNATSILTRPRAGATSGHSNNPFQRRELSEDTSGVTGLAGQGNNADSINLGQLKAHNAAIQAKQKQTIYAYRYDDTDTLMNELEEWYAFVEMPSVAQAPEVFRRGFKGDWTESSMSRRREFVESQLEYLESPVRSERRYAQTSLLYLLHGCFAETTGPEMQLHWVIENAKIVRSLDGVTSLVVALKDALRRYDTAIASDRLNASTSSNGQGSSSAPEAPGDEHSAELMDTLAMLYFLIEVFRSDDSFGDELMAMSPPLPFVLFSILASLKDRLPKGFPVKKILLLLWKTLLACLGGMKEVSKARDVARDMAGLSGASENFTKASPMDISNWRRDTSVKYPTFAPPPSVTANVPNEKLADGIKPIPFRPDFHSTEIQPASPDTSAQRGHQPGNGQQMGSAPMPGTPAPTPPASPIVKPKKQQFQTDPTKPFVFPYTRIPASGSSHSAASLVPFAIAEADRLYHRHSYISLGLYQLWQTRDECIREERGLGRTGLIGFTPSKFLDEDEADMDEEAEEAMRQEWRLEEEEMECEQRGDKEGAKRAAEKRSSFKRLQRVNMIYKHALPIMQSCVIVLLKLLLATVTGPGGASLATQDNLPAGLTSPTQEVPPPIVPPPSREEIDIARHREITSKAVSAILILLLKWFKTSHVLKFHYLAQLLFDSNCLLLVLKMFGLTDLSAAIQPKNESDWSLFRYCHINCSRSPPRAEDELLKQPQPKPAPKPLAEGDETEIEIISEYSWRNFFSTINFLKILQKMTKHRAHRTYMLQQYKSSQILKRMLKVNQPMLQLQVLKLIKSQMPWCGRKWRHGNMKTITSIYLNCRPELRDEWLSGTDLETELEDALPQEYALRALIQFYNKRNYSSHLAVTSNEPTHHRSNSTAAVMLEDPALHPPRSGAGSSFSRGRGSSISESEVFPPRHTDTGMAYNPDGMIEFWLHEYEDVLLEVFGDSSDITHEDHYFSSGNGSGSFGAASGGDYPISPSEPLSPGSSDLGPRVVTRGLPGPMERDDPAWVRLGQIMRAAKGPSDGDDESVISDSESTASVGELGDDARLDPTGGVTGLGMGIGEMGLNDTIDNIEVSNEGEERQDQQEEPVQSPLRASPGFRKHREKSIGENTWEHMSPGVLSLLPKSPAERRRSSSSGSPLRPITGGGLGLGDNPFMDDDEGEIDTRGPMPIEKDTADEHERDFGAVDEVEYAYGE